MSCPGCDAKRRARLDALLMRQYTGEEDEVREMSDELFFTEKPQGDPALVRVYVRIIDASGQHIPAGEISSGDFNAVFNDGVAPVNDAAAKYFTTEYPEVFSLTPWEV